MMTMMMIYEDGGRPKYGRTGWGARDPPRPRVEYIAAAADADEIALTYVIDAGRPLSAATDSASDQIGRRPPGCQQVPQSAVGGHIQSDRSVVTAENCQREDGCDGRQPSVRPSVAVQQPVLGGGLVRRRLDSLTDGQPRATVDGHPPPVPRPKTHRTNSLASVEISGINLAVGIVKGVAPVQ